MKICVFGLGYVGCIELGCLAQDGHDMIGIDVNTRKVDLINEGKSPIIEDKIDKIISENSKAGKIKATTSAIKAVLESDISFICVGTPASETGQINLEYIYKVAEQIGEALKEKKNFHTIVIRSTVIPGVNEKVGQLIEEASSKRRNQDFAVVTNPEFLREGTAVDDYYNPPITVIGTDSDKGKEVMKDLYKNIKAELLIVDIKVAEMIKFVNNAFHALKVSFANEIGNICKAQGIDSHKVMELFCKDTKLNLSSYYLKPGASYGGSCLPKDLKALKTMAHDSYLNTPIIDNIELSNNIQKENVLKMILKEKKKRVGILGLSFKKGTDDLRSSPTVALAESLLGKGIKLTIYDKNVYLSNLLGANKEEIEAKIPHISALITDDLKKAVADAELLVITQRDDDFKTLIDEHPEKMFIDLVKITDSSTNGRYHGVCW